MFDPQLLIEPTNVPFGWALKSLDGQDERWDRLRRNHHLAKGYAEVISGAGFLSYVLRVIFVFDGTEERFSVILKVPTLEKLKAADLVGGDEYPFDNVLVKFHNQEILFYKEIAEYCDVFYFPKMYACVESEEKNAAHGRILVEDVGDKGILPDVLKGMDLKQCSEVIRVLARFHAFTMQNLTEDFLQKLRNMEGKTPERLQLSPATYKLDPYFMEKEEILKQLQDKHGTVEPNLHQRYDMPPVLVHGDFWGNNMFFERNVDGTLGEKIFTIFDWQILRPGTGMADIARFLFVSATETVLKENLEEILQLYYNTMEESLKKKGAKLPYDYEKMKQMFRYEIPFDYLFAAMLLPILLQQTEDEKIRKGVINRLKIGFEYAKEASDWL